MQKNLQKTNVIVANRVAVVVKKSLSFFTNKSKSHEHKH